MSGLKSFSQKPYFDDFDSEKNFHRVLYRPGFAVQTREMNTMQTMLQNQIGNMADSVWENGQRVNRGEPRYNNRADYITLTANMSRLTKEDYIGLEVELGDLKAKVIDIVYEGGVSDPCLVFISYTSGDGAKVKFEASDVVTFNLTDTSTETATISGIGEGSVFTIDSGVYYINSTFVNVESQSVILSKTTPLASNVEKRVGFLVDDTIVTPVDDVSLYDNALGTTNESAPGAHRYSIQCTLVDFDNVASDLVKNFVEISRIRVDEIQTKSRTNEYTVLERSLAERTYDQSGDFIVDDFLLDVREHLNDGTNNGTYTLAQGGLESKLSLFLDPGKAYVSGYPVVTTANTYLETDKARTTQDEDNVFVTLQYDQALFVTPSGSGSNVPILFTKINLRDVSNAVIGTAIIRDYAYDSSGAFRLSIFDVRMNSGKYLADTKSVVQDANFNATVSSISSDNRQSSLLFPVNRGMLSSISSATLTFRKKYVGTVSGTNVVLGDSAVTFSSNRDEYVCVVQQAGGFTTVRPASVTVNAGVGVTVSISNTTPVNGSSVNIYARVSKSNVAFKTKVKTTQVDTITAASSMTLSKVDIIGITSIVIAGNDCTSLFDLDNGQRDTIYQFGKLALKSGYSLPSGTATITYEYFAHGAGDVLSVNSYADYDVIPTYKDSLGVDHFLGNVFDFRPIETSTGASYDLSSGNVFIRNSDIVTDVSRYLGRYIKIVVDNFGAFSVVEGIPATNPVPPSDIKDTMTLYTVLINPYTFDTKDVEITKHMYKQYTMKDIGYLDGRLSNVEYYTALNMLEKSVIDRNYADKFNSGFIVDNFTTQAVADEVSPELKCSFDMTNQQCRPESVNTIVEMGNGTLSNTVINNGILTKSFAEVDYINQPFGTKIERIQPYINYRWNGELSLSPATDIWVDTKTLPDVIIGTGTLNVTTGQFFEEGSWTDRTFDAIGGVGASSTSVARLSRRWRQATTTTVVDTQESLVFEGEVRRSIIPFIRSRTITITGGGFKPNTKVTPFFDNRDVSAYCRNSIGVLGGQIVTNNVGEVALTFTIPNTDAIRFRTGTRVFSLRDGVSEDVSTTIGEGSYFANGELSEVQRTVTQTRIVQQSVWSYKTDPLAETFYVGDPGGIFVTSIDIYMGSIPASNRNPVWVELRDVVNGYPGATVIAKSLKDYTQLTGSSNGSVATRFGFDAPVHLSEGKEYCFVVMSDSETLTIWIATLGERAYRDSDSSVPTGQIVSKQPFLGSMFRSQNNRTWTADQWSDIKFKINRAQFHVGTGTANLRNKKDDATVENILVDTLTEPFVFTTGINTIKVIHRSHGFTTGASTTFTTDSIQASYFGIPGSKIFDVAKTVTVVDMDTYTFTTTDNATLSGVGGNIVYAPKVIAYSEAAVMADQYILNGCNVSHTVTGMKRGTNTTTSATLNPYVVHEFGEMLTVLADNDGRLTSNITLTNDNDRLSPIVDMQRYAIACKTNRVDMTNTRAAYVQKKTALVNPANELRMYLDVNRQPGTYIEVYYKVDSSDWVQATPDGALAYTNATDFVEYKYTSGVLSSDFFECRIKGVFKSDTGAFAPKIKNVRTIALKS